MRQGFDCMMDCPNGKHCTSASRDYPCSVYYALRKRRIDSKTLENEKRISDTPVTYRNLKRVYREEN